MKTRSHGRGELWTNYNCRRRRWASKSPWKHPRRASATAILRTVSSRHRPKSLIWPRWQRMKSWSLHPESKPS